MYKKKNIFQHKIVAIKFPLHWFLRGKKFELHNISYGVDIYVVTHTNRCMFVTSSDTMNLHTAPLD